MKRSKPKHFLIQEELERRILQGVSLHWDLAASYLKPFQRAGFQKPIFRLKDLKRTHGYWSPEKNEICLSRSLVLKHSWDSVVEVLLHEMAHQYAHHVLGGIQERPHGVIFQKACELLKANPKASGTYKLLDERVADGEADTADKIVVKVKKLMALARSQNRHEAEAAMAKAHSLIARHNVDLIEKDMQRNFLSIFVGKPALRHTRDTTYLANLLQSFYFVKILWIPAFVIEKNKMGNVLEITGTVQNVKLADYVYQVVRNFIDRQWELYNKERGLTLHRKTDFAIGIIRGFREKLESQRTARNDKQSNSTALINCEDPKLNEFFRFKYPRIVTSSLGNTNEDFDVMNDGVKKGKKLVISRGIEKKEGNKGLCLPH